MNETDPIAIVAVLTLLSSALCVASCFFCRMRNEYYRQIQNTPLEELFV